MKEVSSTWNSGDDYSTYCLTHQQITLHSLRENDAEEAIRNLKIYLGSLTPIIKEEHREEAKKLIQEAEKQINNTVRTSAEEYHGIKNNDLTKIWDAFDYIAVKHRESGLLTPTKTERLGFDVKEFMRKIQ